MKLEITERGENSFYDEFLYILSNYKKILINPKMKVSKLTLYALKLTIISLVFLILFTIFYILDSSFKFFIVVIGLFTFLVILGTIYYFLIRSNIKKLKNKEGTIVIKFNDDEIEYNSDNNFKLKWNDINNIIINKYSISFIPKSKDNILMSIDKKYLNDVLKAINKYKKEELLVDNSQLY